ncbi:acyl-CoA dehydrogenase [Pseudoduganella sp. DS3]|uniref:Cyclohexane-1-carbonyl-CoA dehydrogenase n=1 Tax=Pseudoduganella guangdongensis TaxID=2692179 RepID=A0A6N9HMA9_9BURK|nr:acyl-CoA dehydrogenase family protein [Pseudoduganella guangdongensis]MYN04519.1 acyl-CoA dehydrogenase [Pseudoduganella guangdongensis]
MEFSLNDEQREFQQAARAFAQGELEPNAARWDADAYFSVEAIAKAGELGFCGLYTPPRWGGLGLTRLDAAVIFEELAAGCTSTTAYLTIHNMATWMIARWGQESFCEQWVPALASGAKLASYCLTEPNAGSDAASLRTRAERDGDTYVVTGSKAFISGGSRTDMLVVMARTGGPGPEGISAFAIPADTPGVSFGKLEEKMGWNSQPTCAINFDSVRVPAANRLGDEGQGFAIAMKGLDGGRINIATCSIGTAQAALNRAQFHLKERVQFGRELAQFQALQFKLADMLTELVAARQMVRLAAWKLDTESPDASAYCAMAKRFATDAGFTVANDALQLHGGYGYIREYPLERHVRDTRVHQILEGTNEIMRLIIARAILRDGATETLT